MMMMVAIVVGAAGGCLALGYFIGSKRSSPSPSALLSFLSPEPKPNNNKNRLKQPLQIENLADILEDFKMVSFPPSLCLSLYIPQFLSFYHHCLYLSSYLSFIQVLVVRNDLKMGKGKIAAQCRSLPFLLFPLSLILNQSSHIYHFWVPTTYLPSFFAALA